MARLLAPSPFKTGCLVVLAAVLLFYSFGIQKPELLQDLDNRVVDAMFQWRGAHPPSHSVVIVDIDEKSLRHLGQWPWSRDVVAEMVAALHRAGARVVGLDIVFAEPDRTSPKRYLAELPRSLGPLIPPDILERVRRDEAIDHDLILGKAVTAGPTVLGYVFQTLADGLKSATEIPFPSSSLRVAGGDVSYDRLTLLPAYRAIVNIPDVAQAESEGFFNVFPDSSGTVRKVPLLMVMDAIPYPSLALEMVRIGLAEQEIVIHVSQQARDNRRGILGISVGRHFIPTDDQGQISVNYRGPQNTFLHLPAVDVLNGLHREMLRGRYVLIGTSASGLLDLRATPFSNVFPGVEVHANVIDNILAGDPITYDVFTEIGVTSVLIIAGGLFLAALLAYSSPLAGGLGGFLLLSATIAGNYQFFFLHNKIIGLTYPLLTFALVFLVVTLFNYFFEGREKRFIRHAFGHYVSPQVVSKLMDHPENLTLAGQEKNLTVMFSDIRQFTSISENMSPLQLGAFMNRYLTAMSSVVMENRGTVDKFIGDAIMAIWGAPLDDEDHAGNAVRAALEMVRRLEALRPEWEREGLPAIDIGIGINTGTTIVGNFGSQERFDYTVLGDNVNLASRLEGSNKTYGTRIIISEFTREALADRFLCRFIDLVRVKGRLKPVRIYEPLTEGKGDEGLRREVARFAKAMEAYHDQRFEEAALLVEELQRMRPCRLYSLYLERIGACRLQPPPKEWDGVFVFTCK